MKYITLKDGKRYGIEFASMIENGKTVVGVYSEHYGYTEHYLKVGYRPERTWDDHMGNTPSGYYVTIPFPQTGERRRVYMF